MKSQEADNPEEILDLVDENDNVIGQKSRGDIYKEGLANFRVVNIFLVNNEGKLWIPRRTAHKKLYPLHLDMSAAGHVETGETYEEAARKEMQEELHMNPFLFPLCDLGYLSPKDTVDVACMQHMHTYVVQTDTTPEYNKDDFVEYDWLYPKEVLERINSGDKAKNHLPMLVKKYFT